MSPLSEAGFALVVLLASSLTGAAGQRGHDIGNNARARTLANGLTVVVVERPGTASFGGVLACKAGSVDDPPGGAGTAHLVEHFLAGQTTALIGAPKPLMRDLGLEYERTGGVDSARSKALEAEVAAWRGKQRRIIATTHDLVFYGVVDYPARGLDRFLQAQSQALKAFPSRVMATEKQGLVNEITGALSRDVANQSSANNLGTAYPGHPYGAPVGGLVADISATTLDSLRAFYQTHYVPGRCAVAIVGDVPSAAVFSMADEYFGNIPNTPESAETPPPPPAPGEKRRTIASVAGPRLIVSFRKPPTPSRDDAVADVVASLLGGGSESRLSRDLTGAGGLATEVDAANGGPGLRYDNLVTIGAVPGAGHRPEELEAPILRHLDALQAQPAGADDLRAAIARLEKLRASEYASDFAVAIAIVRHQVALGDWTVMLRTREAYRTVSATEVMAFARKYFTQENRSVTTLLAVLR